MIEVQNLTKYYGNRAAIEDVTFSLDAGKILGFLGPNGAGKTTTMRILTGYMPASSGTARVAGYDVFAQSLEVRRRIGYLPETVPLYTDLSVRDYLNFVAKIRAVPRARRRAAVEDAMVRCWINDRADSLIGKLSKGLRQRVGLAQAILHDPDLLVLDEPTVGLDPAQKVETLNLIKELGRVHTVILSTHILSEVAATCERVVIINNGRIIVDDTLESFVARQQAGQRIQLDVRGDAQQVAAAVRGIDGVVHVEVPGRDSRLLVECRRDRDVRAELAATVVRGGWGLLELRTVSMSLEEAFIRSISEEAEVEAPAA